jgi:hypothetical protein
MVRPIPKDLWWVLGLILVCSGCATVKAPDEKEPVTPTYTLSSSKPVRHQKPLPIESTILVHWKLGEIEKTVKGFRAWDFNHDGKFDMLETLSEEGQITGRAFDFDGDGRIDIKQAANKESSHEAIPKDVALNQSEHQKAPSIEEAMEVLKVAH